MLSLVVLVALVSLTRGALTANKLVAFGDSYVDDNGPHGNWRTRQWPPSPPYAHRWSDGMTTPGHLAQMLGLPCDWTRASAADGVQCEHVRLRALTTTSPKSHTLKKKCTL